MVLTLDQPLRDGNLKYFELAGPDGRFHNAEATAVGNTITITAPAAFATMSGSPATVSGTSSAGKPTAVRYAWKDNPLGVDAYSLDGLPLSPFELKL